MFLLPAVVGQRPVSLSGSEPDNVTDSILAGLKDGDRRLEQVSTYSLALSFLFLLMNPWKRISNQR